MKRNQIISYFFCGIFILYAFAFSPIILWVQEEAKEEMADNINNNKIQNDIITLSLSKSEFSKITWLDNSEISVNGVLYDLLNDETTPAGDHILKVITDNKEKRAVDVLAKQSHQDASSKKGIGFLLVAFTNFSSVKPHYLIPASEISRITFTYCNFYRSFYSEISSPPPKLS